jgi:hypothetical protein
MGRGRAIMRAMASRLLFDTHSGLREEEDVLVGFEDGSDGAYLRLLPQQGDAYEVLRQGRHGWRFTLRTAAGREVGTFHAARVGRGGTIVGDGGELTLRAKAFSGLWRLTFPLRAPIEIQPASWLVPAGGSRYTFRHGLELNAPEGVPAGSDSLAQLAFACWLISEIQLVASAAGGLGGGGS